MHPDLSVVIPVFNEADRLEAGLTRVLAYLRSVDFTTELIVVDDGSTDRTAEMALESVPPGVGRVLSQPHRGKGGAVRAGMLEARGRYTVFMDVDLATPIELVQSCLRVLSEEADVVIGSRRVQHAVIEQHQGLAREFLGRGFSALSRFITGVDVSDFTCGFKAFRAEAARAVFSRQRIDNWSFDAEILFLADRLGFDVRELPVRWRDDRRTKVRVYRDIVGSLVGLARIRLNHLLGRYRLPEL